MEKKGLFGILVAESSPWSVGIIMAGTQSWGKSERKEEEGRGLENPIW